MVSCLVISGATAASAQGVASVGSTVPDAQIRARFQIAAMEGVLERAVQLGAKRLSAQVQAVSSDVLFIATAARAKGFWLDGYGVFFDVDVPAMRHSMAWSFRTLDRGGKNVEADMNTIRRYLTLIHDPQAKRDIEAAVQRMERVMGPPVMPPGIDPGGPPPGAPGGNGLVPAGHVTGTSEPDAPAPAVLDDPGTAYTDQVKRALIDAMLEYGTMPIADTEWLTIAARDNNDSRIGGDDPFDVSTIILRIKGTDLTAYRAGRLSKEEALKRVDVREY
jgi:hypothetical protein